MPKLRAVTPDDKASPRKLTVVAAAADGDRRELLVALRSRVAKALDDPNTAARDLAALTRRMQEIARDIEAIDSEEGGDDIGDAAGTPDEAFRSEAL